MIANGCFSYHLILVTNLTTIAVELNSIHYILIHLHWLIFNITPLYIINHIYSGNFFVIILLSNFKHRDHQPIIIKYLHIYLFLSFYCKFQTAKEQSPDRRISLCFFLSKLRLDPMYSNFGLLRGTCKVIFKSHQYAKVKFLKGYQTKIKLSCSLIPY